MGKIVEISLEEYKQLVKDSTALEILKEYAENAAYLSGETIRCVLGIKQKDAFEDDTEIDYTDDADAGVVYSCSDEQEGIGE